MAGRRVEVLIIRLQKPEVYPVGVALGRGVRAEHDAVLVLHDEASGAVRLPAQLRDAGVDVRVHVGIGVQPLADRCQVFGVIAEVRANKRCLRMPGNDTVSLVV